MADKKTMKVKMVRSVYGRLQNHRDCVRGLGLRRMHQVVELEDTPATRGMLNKVSYMVDLVEER
jgi:large subunit ribosomal protein L30